MTHHLRIGKREHQRLEMNVKNKLRVYLLFDKNFPKTSCGWKNGHQ